MMITQRREAISQGVKFYFTGKPCKRGHIAQRWTVQGGCVVCVKEHQDQRKANGTRSQSLHDYNHGEKGKANHLRFRQSPLGQQRYETYTKSEARRIANRTFKKRLAQTEKGKLDHRRREHLRRARKYGVECVPYSLNQRNARFALFGNVCVYCSASENLTEDHFYPLATGGPHRIENIVPACLQCNLKKHDKDPEQWYKTQPFFSRDRWLRLLRETHYDMEVAA